MGITRSKLTLKKHKEDRKDFDINFLIDSGATYTLVPSDILERFKIKPDREMEFTLADGTVIKRKVGDAYIGYQDKGAYSPVIFGEEGDEPLLGAITLENIGLILDPFKRKLRPMKMMM